MDKKTGISQLERKLCSALKRALFDEHISVCITAERAIRSVLAEWDQSARSEGEIASRARTK